MRAPGGSLPNGKLADAITESFTSFDEFKKQVLLETGKNQVLGSGWAWLSISDDGKLLSARRQIRIIH